MQPQTAANPIHTGWKILCLDSVGHKKVISGKVGRCDNTDLLCLKNGGFVVATTVYWQQHLVQCGIDNINIYICCQKIQILEKQQNIETILPLLGVQVSKTSNNGNLLANVFQRDAFFQIACCKRTQQLQNFAPLKNFVQAPVTIANVEAGCSNYNDPQPTISQIQQN
eukprot:TRINITY_DN3557_c0_g1_i1.p3 TRINITY_DN3557_c0_g1~~TRINITY_DN3557_c0_g1_i1.p3  ORF type:complete len:168 (-),score=15.52 TRINITY_DN3557_c0_g1_i1:396-899(-)